MNDEDLETRSALSILTHIDREVERIANTIAPTIHFPINAPPFAGAMDYIQPSWSFPANLIGLRWRATFARDTLDLTLEHNDGTRLHWWRHLLAYDGPEAT